MINEHLVRCGLSESEVKVFVSLLESGSTIASLIAKRVNLKRPNVYAILDSLSRLGLVQRHKKGSVTYYSALDKMLIPQVLENHAQYRFNELQQSTALLKDELVHFESSVSAEIAGFDISAVESIEAVFAQLEEFVLTSSFDALFNPQVAFERLEMRNLALRMLENTAEKRAPIREIAVKGKMTDWYKTHIKNPNHQLKEIDADKKVISDVIILPDALILAQYGKSREVGIRLVQSDFHKTMKTIFDMLWESL